MTNEYKSNLLKYFTGTINQTEQSNTPVISGLDEIDNNLNDFIQSNIDGTYSLRMQMVQGKDGTGKDLDRFIIVGEEEYNSIKYGFIVLLDNQLNPIQLIKSYTSGVRLGKIYSIKVADDGTFYMVEYTNATNKLRMVLINNVLVKSEYQDEYYCKLRISYNLPNEIQDDYNSIEIFKNNTGSHYGFICTTDEKIVIETLKIEVGEENEWQNYNYNYFTPLQTNLYYEAGYCYWNEDDFTFEAMLSKKSYGNNSLYRFYLNNSNITYTTLDISSYVLNGAVANFSIQIVEPNHEYVGITSVQYGADDEENGTTEYFILETNNSTITSIYNKFSNYTPPFQWVAIRLIYKNGTLFYFSYFPDNYSQNGVFLDIGLLFNGNVYNVSFEDVVASSFYYFSQTFAITIEYNLVKYIFPLSNYTGLGIIVQIFNEDNYNGIAYEQTKSVLPNSVNIYNEGNLIIFSRNLYNKALYNNTCVSSAQIPNTMLNNITMKNKQLMSYNNNIIVNDDEEITKNIYETLNLNYYNVIEMENKNDIDNITKNLIGASRVNYSANKTQDLIPASATKVMLILQNINDGTQTINYYDLTNAELTINNDIATYDFTIYCPIDYNIVSINIVSNDKETNYLTITGNFEEDKYYRIQQEAIVV